jgi:hypothetical protein
MSGEFQSTGRMRAAARELDDDELDQIVRQAAAVGGLVCARGDPRALAVALGYRTMWAPRLPNDATSIVIDRTIYYANCADDAELCRRIALPLAHLILEAWGYDLGATDRLSERIAG